MVNVNGINWGTVWTGVQAAATVGFGAPTLYWLRKYTHETVRLREQGERQKEAAYTPILHVNFENISAHTIAAVVENIGTSHAFQVEFEFLHQAEGEVKLLPIPFLRAGNKARIEAALSTLMENDQEAAVATAVVHALKIRRCFSIHCRSLSGLIHKFEFEKQKGQGYVLISHTLGRK